MRPDWKRRVVLAAMIAGLCVAGCTAHHVADLRAEPPLSAYAERVVPLRRPAVLDLYRYSMKTSFWPVLVWRLRDADDPPAALRLDRTASISLPAGRTVLVGTPRLEYGSRGGERVAYLESPVKVGGLGPDYPADVPPRRSFAWPATASER